MLRKINTSETHSMQNGIFSCIIILHASSNFRTIIILHGPDARFFYHIYIFLLSTFMFTKVFDIVCELLRVQGV